MQTKFQHLWDTFFKLRFFDSTCINFDHSSNTTSRSNFLFTWRLRPDFLLTLIRYPNFFLWLFYFTTWANQCFFDAPYFVRYCERFLFIQIYLFNYENNTKLLSQVNLFQFYLWQWNFIKYLDLFKLKKFYEKSNFTICVFNQVLTWFFLLIAKLKFYFARICWFLVVCRKTKVFELRLFPLLWKKTWLVAIIFAIYGV